MVSSDASRPGLAPHLTTLGRVGAPYGIKGWVKLISFTDPVENLLDYRQFILGDSNLPGGRGDAGSAGSREEQERIEIDEWRTQGKDLIAHISGCDDRDLARRYTGRSLQVATAELPDLSETGEYYWFQLEGLQVVNLQNEILGRVHHLLETGANDVLVVRPNTDSIDDQERLIPWLLEQVIKTVDLEGGTLRVDWENDY